MPTPFVADAAEEAVRSNTILNERKATDIIEETALEVDIRAWRAEGLRLLQAASAREDHVPNGARDLVARELEDGLVGGVRREPKVERNSDAAEESKVCGIFKGKKVPAEARGANASKDKTEYSAFARFCALRRRGLPQERGSERDWRRVFIFDHRCAKAT